MDSTDTKVATKKQENIAVRLAGRVKNFTGKGPDVIQVKIEGSLVNVRLKWLLSEQEKRYLYSCKRKNQELIGSMRNDLNEQVNSRLLRVISQFFDGPLEVVGINEESFQEKLSVTVRAWEQVS